MNLQENIQRIKEMMNITESESKTNVIKGLIDNCLEEMKETCNNNDEDNEYLSYETCELLDSDFKYIINDISQVQGKMYIELKIYYNNYNFVGDEESFEWDLYYFLKKWIPNCAIKVIELNNTYDPELRQW
jgi:hypothetical protein